MLAVHHPAEHDVGVGGAYGFKPGALVVQGPNPLTVTNVSITHYQGYAVSSETPFDPASTEINVADIGTTSAADAIVWLKVPTLLVGFPGVAKAGSADNQVIRVGQAGTFTTSGTIKAFFVPEVFDGQVTVSSAGTPTKLTIQKNRLLFAAGKAFLVGAAGSPTTTGDLVATNVTFDEAVAGAGWGGLRFADQFTAASDVSGGLLHAADPANGNTSISINMQGTGVTAVAPTLHDLTVGPPHALGPCITSRSDTNHAQPIRYASARIVKNGCAPTVRFLSAGGPAPADIP